MFRAQVLWCVAWEQQRSISWNTCKRKRTEQLSVCLSSFRREVLLGWNSTPWNLGSWSLCCWFTQLLSEASSFDLFSTHILSKAILPIRFWQDHKCWHVPRILHFHSVHPTGKRQHPSSPHLWRRAFVKQWIHHSCLPCVQNAHLIVSDESGLETTRRRQTKQTGRVNWIPFPGSGISNLIFSKTTELCGECNLSNQKR